MKKIKKTIFYFILTCVFLAYFSQTSFATTITVSSFSISNTDLNYGKNPRLRIIANNSFVNSADGKVSSAQLPTASGDGSAVETVVTTATELDTAITTANSNRTTNYSVKANGTLTISSHKTIPANIYIVAVNNSKFVKSGSGTIAFAGRGLVYPTAESIMFSGFAVGDITFTGTGTNFPSQISTALFDNPTASARINIADRAFIGKKVQILATSGNIGEQIIVSEGHELFLQAGTFTNSSSAVPNVIIYSNTWIRGAGKGRTIVYESNSTDPDAGQLFYGSSVPNRFAANDTLHINENITVSDMTIEGEPSRKVSQNNSVVLLGNVKNGRIERIHFRRNHGYAAYFGTNTDSGTYAKNCFILDNVFEDIGTQVAGSINSDGLIISGNQFIDTGHFRISYSNFIDLEPNTSGGKMENIIISNNIMNAIGGAARQKNAIYVQAGGVDRAKNITIENNQITGTILPNGGQGISAGIVLYNVEGGHIRNNEITGTSRPAITVFNSSQVHTTGNTMIQVGNRNGGVPAIQIAGLNDSIFADNKFPKRNNHPSSLNNYINRNYNDSAEIQELDWKQIANVITSRGVTTVTVSQVSEAVGFFDYWVGRQISLSGGGVTPGIYTIASVNVFALSVTLTTPAGNGTGVLIKSKFSNNRYINNLNAYYTIPSDSNSTITDTTNGEPVYFYNTVALGNLDTAYTLGNLNVNQKTYFNIVSIEANSKTAPVGCTTNAVLEVIGDRGDGGGTKSITLPITGASNLVKTNVFYGNVEGSVLVKVLTAAAGCSTFPSNYNIAVGYQTGVKVARIPTDTTNLTSTGISSTTIGLSWSAAKADAGILTIRDTDFNLIRLIRCTDYSRNDGNDF